MFRRRYLLGEYVPPSLSAHIGTGLHKAAEVNYRAKHQTGTDEPLDVLQDAAHDGYVKAVKEGGVYILPEERPQAKAMAGQAIDEVVALAAAFRAEIAPAVTPSALVEARLEIEVPGLAPTISGTLDLVDDEGRVVDLKTSARSWPQSRADNNHQATIYAGLLARAAGIEAPEIRFDVLVKGREPKAQHLTTTRTAEDFSALVERVKLMMATVQAGIFPPAPSGAWVCSPRYCGYFYTCRHIPAYKRALPKRSI